ncbi:hypothetical protein GCK32_002382 [Trichostrongylus colubriformis]|uniref:Uncharacterized protein n=1 Tax=Trichostrongylus colubriformis TaxID=6319 RepID=A0AAN8FA09_TRICO
MDTHLTLSFLLNVERRSTDDVLSRSYYSDLMTVLTCPDTLSPSYLADSQLIMECTETEQMTTTCPAPAKCVKAPRDVLRRSVCCSATINTT